MDLILAYPLDLFNENLDIAGLIPFWLNRWRASADGNNHNARKNASQVSFAHIGTSPRLPSIYR
jgi:hypothetical protein